MTDKIRAAYIEWSIEAYGSGTPPIFCEEAFFMANKAKRWAESGGEV